MSHVRCTGWTVSGPCSHVFSVYLTHYRYVLANGPVKGNVREEGGTWREANLQPRERLMPRRAGVVACVGCSPGLAHILKYITIV